MSIPKKCSYGTCVGHSYAKKLCRVHYVRLNRGASLDKPMPIKRLAPVKTNKLYGTWCAIKNRCYSPSSRDYYKYGARGITMCDRWRMSFDDFYNDMGDKPAPDYSIERIDNNKGYSPENCIWADKTRQAQNRRLTVKNKYGYHGIKQRESGRWEARIRYDKKYINLGTYNTKKEAYKAYIEKRKILKNVSLTANI